MQPISYKQTILVPRANCVDVIDPTTRKWFTARTLQAAKWNVTVWRRLTEQFVAQPT